GRDNPRAETAGLVEILSLRDVQRAVTQPVAHAAFVAERDAADPGKRVLARDMPAFLADHQHDLALVVEFIRYLRPHDRLAAADERSWEAAKQVGIFRRFDRDS